MRVYDNDDTCWQIASLHDKRRGLWFRVLPDGELQICGGREGDDCYVSFRVGDVMDQEKFSELLGCLESARYGRELSGMCTCPGQKCEVSHCLNCKSKVDGSSPS